MPRRFRDSILLVVLVLLVFSAAWGQKKGATTTTTPDFSRLVDLTEYRPLQYQEFEKTPLTFSSKAQYVLVPVLVTDKDGKSVTGLKKEDFHLQENGKDVLISSVDEFIPTSTSPARLIQKKANEASNELAIENKAPQRLIIIAIDMVNTPFLDQVRSRQQVISYLSKELEPDSLYQIVAVENNGLRVLHDYTQSSEELIATLKKIHSRFTSMDGVDQTAMADFGSKGVGNGPNGTIAVSPGATSIGPSENTIFLDPAADFEAWATAKGAAAEGTYASNLSAAAAQSTLTALQQIAHRTSGISGRKSLIWVTGGFPFSLDPVTARFSSPVAFDVYQHVMQDLNDQMIAVYPVDARGLLTTNVDASVHTTLLQNTFSGAMISDSATRQHDILETMRSFAEMTGGKAYVNTNDTAEAVHRAALDGSHYYLLTYPLDQSNRRAGWRKITVKVGSYAVRARNGYYLTQATVDPLPSARFDIETALRSPLDYTGVPLRVVLQPEQTADGKKKVPFSTLIPPAGIKVDTAENNHVFLEISYAVLTPEGNTTSKQDKSYNLNLNAEQMKQVSAMGLGFGDTLELAPGNYRLRVVVRDNLNGRVGSVLADVHAE